MYSVRYLIWKLCSRDWNLTTSPIDTMPTTSSFSTTGRWRMRRSVMIAIASSIDVSGVTYIKGDDMISPTSVSWLVRPKIAIFRRESRSVMIPTTSSSRVTRIDPTFCSTIFLIASNTVADASIFRTSLCLPRRISETCAKAVTLTCSLAGDQVHELPRDDDRLADHAAVEMRHDTG